MQANRHCIVCILNQVLRVANYLELDEKKKDLIFQKALKKAADTPYTDITSPEFAEKIYKVIEDISGEPDPYKTLRRKQNRMVMDQIDIFRKKIEHSADPLLTSGYYALLGNIIDYGGVRIFDTDEIFKQCEEIEITVNDYPKFRKQLQQATRVLILADNAGEAVFDKLFIEEMKRFNPGLEIFYGVRSKPAINDVIREDVEYIGINRVAHILETGATCAGVVVSKSTEAFKKIYYNSDIIISKGQGNFETLEKEREDILFIFRVKCDIVAKYINLDLGSLIFTFKSGLIQGN